MKMESMDRRRNIVIKGVIFGEQNLKGGVAVRNTDEIKVKTNIIETAEIKMKREQKVILVKQNPS